MRTYANFLLFEDVLTNLPSGSISINAMANTLVAPIVKVTTDDCGTFIGTIETVDNTLVGRVELSTGLPITADRVAQLISQGINSLRVRDLHSCIAKDGICPLCYNSSTGYSTSKGSSIQVLSEFVYTSDVIVGDGISTEYPLSQTPSQYSRTSYNSTVDTMVNHLTDTSIVFNSIRTPSDVYVLHYYMKSSDPFLEYIAKSYSGGLLGIAPLPSFPTILRTSLYQTMFSSNQIALLKSDLVEFAPSTQQQYLDYCDIIRDPLEKILFIIYLYAIFANVQ